MAASRIALMVVPPLLAFVFVMLAVTALLQDVIYFSLFVGIPAGLVASVLVAVVLHIALREG